MKALLLDIKQVWRTKFWFQLASYYLLALALLALTLDWFPLHYAPDFLDLQHTRISPFDEAAATSGHVLGTDALGRDVLANTLYGARTGLLIALPVMLLSCVLGILIGTCAGYFGNDTLKLHYAGLIVLLGALGCIYFYGFYIPLQASSLNLGATPVLYSLLLLAALLLLLRFILFPLLLQIRLLKRTLNFPLDKLTLRTIEIITSVPKLILILALASFITPSLEMLSALLAFTFWTGTARLTRAEMLRIKELPYIEAAKSVGLTHTQIIWREAIPNLLGPVVVAFTFGVAGILAVESTLSFLGIGLPATTPSWGRLIAGIRSDISAWWLVVFPGVFLTLTVLAFQICSHYLLNSLQHKR